MARSDYIPNHWILSGPASGATFLLTQYVTVHMETNWAPTPFYFTNENQVQLR